jgi:hypothetical protein
MNEITPTRRSAFWLASAGIALALLLAIWVSVDVFLHPSAPYVSYPGDMMLAAGYLTIFVLIAVFLLLRRTRWLLIFAVLLVGLALLVPLATGYLRNSLLLLFWLFIISWFLGHRLLAWLVTDESLIGLEKTALAIPLGWGVLVVLTLMLGLVDLYRPWVYWSLFGLITVWATFKFIIEQKNPLAWPLKIWKRKHPWLDVLVLSLLVVLALGSFFWALAPAVRYDSLSYHLAVPDRYLRAGRMIELPESIQTYYAHYGEMLYTIALLLGDQPLPGLINLSAGMLLTLQVYLLGRRIRSHQTGLLAALLFASIPLVGIEAGTTYIDIFVAVFLTAAVHAALCWRDSRENRWLILVGVFSGLAVGTKITAFWLLLPLIAILLVKAYRDYGWKLQFLRAVATLTFPALILAAPWLIRDWLWTGNPIFPNYNNLFKSPDWFIQPFFFIKADSQTLTSFLAFPWLGITDTHRYYHEAPGAVLGALPMLSLPWLYGWYPRRRGEKRFYWLIFLACCAATGLLFSVAYHARYLLPLYPLMSVLAALNLEMLGRFLFERRKILGAALVGLVMAYLFATRLAFTVRWWEISERYPLQIWLGREQPESFLERVLPVYGAFEFLDQRGAEKVFSVGNELRYYTDAEIHGVPFSKWAYQALHTASNGDQLARHLVRQNIDYVLIYPPEQQHRPDIYQSPALDESFFATYTRLAYCQDQVYVYRFFPQGVDRSGESPVNLLANPGFERIDARGDVASWNLAGTGYRIESGEHVYQDDRALMLPGPGASAYQDVPVTPGRLYTLGNWAKARSAEQQIQLYIQWLDAQFQPLGKSAEWMSMQPQWDFYQLSATAPEEARFARVFVSLVHPGQAWFDALCFVNGDVCP